MSGSSNAQTDIIWPGYVAAMASLLLSLLLVAAVLVVTISQIGNMSALYQQAMADKGFKSRAEVDLLASSVGITDQDLTAPLDQTPIKEPHARNPDLDLARSVFDVTAAREAAKLTAEDRSLLAKVDLSHVDIRRVRVRGLDLANIDLTSQISPADLEKIDFSKIDWKGLEPARIAQLKPFIAKEAIRYKLRLQHQKKTKTNRAVITQKPALTTVPVMVAVNTPTPTPKVEAPVVPEALQFQFVDEAIHPTPTQKQPMVQALAAFHRQHAAIRISTTLSHDDINLRRMAYSRLVAVRALAIESGFVPASVLVAIDTVPGSAVPQREMTLWVKAHKP